VRPPADADDVLAGRLDGLLWRFTLAKNGAPLVYDTIHPCGCYPLFIPTEGVRARPQADSVDEGLFVPRTLRATAFVGRRNLDDPTLIDLRTTAVIHDPDDVRQAGQ